MFLLHTEAPFGHIPILSVDGVEVAGSVNIARFIAERHGEYVMMYTVSLCLPSYFNMNGFKIISHSYMLDVPVSIHCNVAGLAGENDLQNAELGSLMDFVMDIGKKCEDVMKETDKEKQVSMCG